MSQKTLPTTSSRNKGMATRSLPPLLRTGIVKAFLAAVLVSSFLIGSTCLHILQCLGLPLYFFNRRRYYAWQANVKRLTAIFLLTLNHVRAPTTVKVSGDFSVEGQIRPGSSRICNFPDRIIIIANHQIYTDWLFFWWSAYTAGRHADFFVVLKDSLRKIPIIGQVLTIFAWIFLVRNWEQDRQQLINGLTHLSDLAIYSRMWLLIFPEGTNMSSKARDSSKAWAKKAGVSDFEHVLLPRYQGLQLCLTSLADTVDWVYDCTIAYDGVPPGRYGQDIFSLKALYIDGIKAPRVHMYWRRFAVKDIPYNDSDAFKSWLHTQWAAKEDLLVYFQLKGHFPESHGYLTTDIKAEGCLLEVKKSLICAIALLVLGCVYKYVG